MVDIEGLILRNQQGSVEVVDSLYSRKRTEHMAGEHLASEHMAGEHLAGERLAGERQASEKQPRVSSQVLSSAWNRLPEA